ncbi:GNAT family N-acetyltransferase [Streptosporangium sp. NPDC000396]|uniref:GNAT family N-acetyltransferase n=1 Tax=Streptosporangium sp. NPDC000396 TaxID=3366185 RepID=UPI0036B1C7F8
MRVASTHDGRAVGEVLALAFAHDPVIRWMLPEGRGAAKMFATLARHIHPVSEAAVDDTGVIGAAVWDPPGHTPTPWQQLRSLPSLIFAMGQRVSYGQALDEAFKKARPSRPHWYLAHIGTDPAVRGRGAGGALLKSRLAHCDEHGLPAYLESSNETNVPFYEKFGFAVTQEIVLPYQGPTCWAMWRPPA